MIIKSLKRIKLRRTILTPETFAIRKSGMAILHKCFLIQNMFRALDRYQRKIRIKKTLSWCVIKFLEHLTYYYWKMETKKILSRRGSRTESSRKNSGFVWYSGKMTSNFSALKSWDYCNFEISPNDEENWS